MQVVLDETGSWSDLKDKNATMPNDSHGVLRKGEKPSGMLGFLSRNKGRARSPKPREPGVLGKEGARVVISSGR
jgi:serine/threonine kinase 32